MGKSSIFMVDFPDCHVGLPEVQLASRMLSSFLLDPPKVLPTEALTPQPWTVRRREFSGLKNPDHLQKLRWENLTLKWML